MGELQRDDFPAFFESVTGHQPFLWQVELTDRLLKGRVPDVIDVPTGLGKTSTIHCWLFALAATAVKPVVARRLCFVVDRRLVVDAAWDDGRHLEAELVRAIARGGGGPVNAVAAALAGMHTDSGVPPLQVVRMRGGVTWDSRWLVRPDGPALVVGTVDQFGSRLLFRGYGASDRMRPIDAALVGTDSWLVIDEAHIAEPLVRTASSVTRYQATAGGSLFVRPLHVTRMSATTETTGDVILADLDREARSEPFPNAAAAARQRLSAAKPARLVDVEDLAVVSRRRWRDGCLKLGRTLADLAQQTDEDARVVGVIANTIATARAAHDRLLAAGEQAILLIGRCRAYERERLLIEWLPSIRVGAQRDPEAPRLFVVATQTIEVGANLDLDALVTECAPLASLIQRFGRVNRLGERATRTSLIVHAGFAHTEDDPVYGASNAATWAFLTDRYEVDPVRSKAARLPSLDGPPRLEIGLRSARALVDDSRRQGRPTAPEPPLVPALLGAHLERWAATHPAPFPDQPVAVFLHGVARSVPEVEVAWRAAPPDAEDDATAWRWWLDLVRPVEWEFVRVPVWELRALLADQPAQQVTADLEELDAGWQEEEMEDTGPPEKVFGVVYRGATEVPRLIRRPRDVDVGDRVVLDATVGGHDAWGWTGFRASDDEPVPDVADLARKEGSGTLRLHPAPLSTFVPEAQRPALQEALRPLLGPLSDDRPPVAERLDPGLLSAALEDLEGVLPEHLLPLLGRARRWQALPVMGDAGARTVILLVESRGSATPVDAITDEDVLATSSGPRRQSLREHGEEVAELAGRFAEHLGLPDELQRALRLAGLWHDAGKADHRFQVSLHDGDQLAAMAAAEPLAKSGRDFRDPAARRAHQLSGLPRGFRHEAVSARLVRALSCEHPDAFEELDLDLVRHLVASHHGQARPLFRPVADPGAQAVGVELGGHTVKVDGADQLDWEHPARFEALHARYGWWGLALLETLVRLADIRCSEVTP